MIHYRFVFADGSRAEFEVDDEAATAPPLRRSEGLPAWMHLDKYRCPHCPLPDGPGVACPAMDALFSTIQAFEQHASTEACELTVEHNGVTFQARTPLQNAVRALLGLQLALSACPTLSRLRPMARFHAPLSGPDETLFRVFGMYLVDQLFRQKRGQTPDWSLAGLQAIYQDIHTVNDRLADRIRDATQKDATVNGVVILDALAHVVEWNIQNGLERLAPYFAPPA